MIRIPIFFLSLFHPKTMVTVLQDTDSLKKMERKVIFSSSVDNVWVIFTWDSRNLHDMFLNMAYYHFLSNDKHDINIIISNNLYNHERKMLILLMNLHNTLFNILSFEHYWAYPLL